MHLKSTEWNWAQNTCNKSDSWIIMEMPYQQIIGNVCRVFRYVPNFLTDNLNVVYDFKLIN